jgi:hypothetical protein
VVDGMETTEIPEPPIGRVVFNGSKTLQVLAGSKRLELELTEE